MMNTATEIFEAAKVLGLNVGTFAVVTPSDLALLLKCILLAVTISYTIFKAIAAWRALNDKGK